MTQEKKIPLELPEGAALESYQICHVLFENEESIVYDAVDTKTQEAVWIREFCPRRIVFREEGSFSLIPKEEEYTNYKIGMAAFEDLFQTIKNAGEVENLIPILRIFYLHNTIYVVNKSISARSMRDVMEQHPQGLPWVEVKKKMMKLLNSVAIFHRKGVVHLGISPENLFVTEDNRIFLCGFCTVESRSENGTLGSERYSGFSSPEQYTGGVWNGGICSDVYALGAILYWLLTGIVPQDAKSRLEQDSLVPAAQLDPSIPENVSDAISAAMMLDPDLRTGSVDELASALLESVSGNTCVYQVPDVMPNEHTVHLEQPVHRFRHVLLTTLISIVLLGGIAVWAYISVMEQQRLYQEQKRQEEMQQQKSLIPVPDFVGHQVSNIQNNAQYSQQFSFEISEEYNDNYPEGIIVWQSPHKGSEVEKMTKVKLVVSKGSNNAEVPAVVGCDLELAKSMMDKSQLPYRIYIVENEGYGGNTVFRTDPSEGTKIALNNGEVVKIYATPPQKQEEEDDKKD